MLRPVLALAGLVLALAAAPHAQSVTVALTAPPGLAGAALGLRGDTPPLAWDRSLPLTDPDGDGLFTARLDFAPGTLVVEVKAVAERRGAEPVWEDGPNRVLLPGRVAEDRRAFGAPQAALPEPTVPVADVQADLALLADALAALHPGLTLHTAEAERAAAARRLASDIRDLARAHDDALPLGDVLLAVARFLAHLRDGHTQLNPYNQNGLTRATLFARADRVPFAFRLVGRRMIVTGDATPDGTLSAGTEVLTLDGRPVGAVLDALVPLVRADGGNDAKRLDLLQVTGHEPAAEFDLFYSLALSPSGPLAVRVRRPDGETVDLTLARTTADARRAVLDARAGGAPRPFEAAVGPDGTARLRIASFSQMDLPDGAAQIAAAFEAVAAQGAERLVVDLRGNEGGMDDAAQALFAHLIARPVVVPARRTVTAYRRMPDALRPHVRSWTDDVLDFGDAVVPAPGGGFEQAEAVPDTLAPAPAAFRGPAVVLVDAAASSATFSLSREIQRTGAATLVGQTTGGSLRGTNGGLIAFVTLPHTGLVVDIPLLGSRPEAPAPDAGIVPDVLVAPDADAVRAGRDLEAEAALAVLAAGVRPALAPFQPLVGTWAGTLVYTDYGDDATRVTLGVRTSATAAPDGTALVVSTVYTEPDGRTVDGGTARLEPGIDRAALRWGGTDWTVTAHDAAAGRLSLVFEQDGDDNGRPARIRETLTADGATWTLRKEVRYAGTAAFFERHTYRFARTD